MIALPARWRRSAAPDRGVLVAARSARPGASGIVPLIRLEVLAVTGSLHTWRERDLAALAARRTDFELDDEDDYELDGRAVAYRRFAYPPRAPTTCSASSGPGSWTAWATR